MDFKTILFVLLAITVGIWLGRKYPAVFPIIK